MTPDELETLILEARDPWQLQKAFEPLDEKERARLSPAAQKIHGQLYKNKASEGASGRLRQFIAGRKGAIWQVWNADETRRATLALFALCPISVARKPDVRIFYQDREVFERLISDRRPEWLDDWLAHDLEQEASRVDFPTLRTWIRSGICRKPEVDGYYRMFAEHMMRTGFYHRGELVPPLSRQLLDDPDLLADIDSLFRVESVAFNTNEWLTRGANDEYETWTDALIKLSAQGHLDREHLLNLALDGLTLDLKQNQLSGFHDFYRRMAPEAAERSRHQQGYIALLCHPVGHVAKFAIEMLSEVEKMSALDTEPVLREIQSVFASGGKGNAIAALKLTNRIIKRQKDGDPTALSAVCEALRHVHADVQSLALDLLEKNVGRLDHAQRDTLRDLASFVSASNRKRLSALLGNAAVTRPAAREAGEIAAVKAVPATAGDAEPRAPSYCVQSSDILGHRILFPEDELAPIGSVDDLIDAVLHATEIVDSPDDIERIIDAISRLARDRAFDFEARVAPLLHRLGNARGGTNGLLIGHVGVGVALQDLIHTWLNGRLHETKFRAGYEGEHGFVPMIAHLRAVAERVARRQGRPVLAAPTHKGGWIDPRAWIERLESLPPGNDIVDSMDFRLSLLRLAPDHRRAALDRATTLAEPLRRIVSFALGGDEFPTKADRGSHEAWIIAARCRGPHQNWRETFAPLELEDSWPGGLAPARYIWRSSHEKGEYQQYRWKRARLEIDVAGDAAPIPIERASGILARVGQGLSGRIATDWTALPTAAVNRMAKEVHFWSGEPHTMWLAQWLAYVWPQNPAAVQLKGVTNLIQRMDDDSSSWSPSSGYFQSLFQRNRPWLEPGHLLLCIGLVGKDADAKGLAVDALIEGIDGRLFDPDMFAAVMSRLSEGEWVKHGRLGDALMAAIQVSELHAAVVSEALQKWLPTLDLGQQNAFRILEVLVEAQAAARQELGEEAREALRRFEGSGKAARIARQLLAA